MHHTSGFGPDHGNSSGSSSGSKRTFEKVIGDSVQGAPAGDKRQKRPSLASVVVEAVKQELCSTLEPIIRKVVKQELCSTLEPVVRKVVGEAVELVVARLVPTNGLEASTTSKQTQESPVSDLRLDFTTKLSLPLSTSRKVKGEGCLPMLIELKDATTGLVFTTGPASNAKLEVVVLDGDFTNDNEEWSFEEFENHVVKERKGKGPLLIGDLNVILKEGFGSLGEFRFTDNSSWMRSRKFRLGARVAPGFCEGIRVQECKTDAFVVIDGRGELYKKHYPPSWSDEVWRLENIAKNGAFDMKLQQNKINTVGEFLGCYVRDQQKLRNILGSGMSNNKWESIVNHAKTCMPSGKLGSVTEYESGTLVGLSQQPGDLRMPSTISIPASIATPQLYGYGAEPSSRYGHQDHELNQSNQLFNSGGNPQGQGFAAQIPLTPAVDDDPIDKNLRALLEEMLENEEMQQLPRQQNFSLSENLHLQGDETYSPMYAPPAVSYEDDRVRASARACVGWLQMKAALQWAIYIKISAKKAMKRAQLEEVED